MVPKHRFVAYSLVLALLFAGAGAVLIACSNQGEGERCDRNGDNAGNDECRDGLRCTAAGELNGSPQTDRCCPVIRTTAAALVCQIPPNPGGGDAAPPPEASVADVSVDSPATDTGTGTETGADTGTDTGSGADAGTDAALPDAADAASNG